MSWLIGAAYEYPLSKRTVDQVLRRLCRWLAKLGKTEFFRSTSVGTDKAPNYSGYQVYRWPLQHSF